MSPCPSDDSLREAGNAISRWRRERSRSGRRFSIAGTAATVLVSAAVWLGSLTERDAPGSGSEVSSFDGGAPLFLPARVELARGPVGEVERRDRRADDPTHERSGRAPSSGSREARRFRGGAASRPSRGAGAAPEPTELVLSGAANLDGATWTADGRPAPGCRVCLTTSSRERVADAETDVDGRFEFDDLPPGQGYRLRLKPPGPQPEEVLALVLEPGSQHVDVVVGERGEGRLGLQLIDTERRPVSNLILGARSATASARTRGVTNSEGRVGLDSVPSGSLVVESFGRPRLTVSGLDLAQDARVDAVVIAALGSYSSRGVVVDQATGSPLVGVRVSAVWTRRGGGVRSSVIQTARTGGSGRFALNGLGAGRFEISAVAPGYQRDEVSVEVPSEQVLELRLPPVR